MQRKELFRELKLLAAAFTVFAIAMKIAYYNESIITVAKTSASLFWLYALPGHAAMLHWKNNLGFAERLAAGTVIAMAAGGIASYYLGLIGLKIQNQTLILPAAIIAVSLALLKFQARKSRQGQEGQGQEQPKA